MSPYYFSLFQSNLPPDNIDLAVLLRFPGHGGIELLTLRHDFTDASPPFFQQCSQPALVLTSTWEFLGTTKATQVSMTYGSAAFLYISLFCPLNIQLKTFLSRLFSLPENTSLWSSGNTSSLVIKVPGLGNQSLPSKTKQTKETLPGTPASNLRYQFSLAESQSQKF